MAAKGWKKVKGKWIKPSTAVYIPMYSAKGKAKKIKIDLGAIKKQKDLCTNTNVYWNLDVSSPPEGSILGKISVLQTQAMTLYNSLTNLKKEIGA